jgi:hypothetical protein
MSNIFDESARKPASNTGVQTNPNNCTRSNVVWLLLDHINKARAIEDRVAEKNLITLLERTCLNGGDA